MGGATRYVWRCVHASHREAAAHIGNVVATTQMSERATAQPQPEDAAASTEEPRFANLNDCFAVIAGFLYLRDLAAFCASCRAVWARLETNQQLWLEVWFRLLAQRFAAPQNCRRALTKRFPHLAYSPFKLPDVDTSTGVAFNFQLSRVDFADLCRRLQLNAHLRSIAFDQGGISAAQLDSLRTALARHGRVTHLTIANNAAHADVDYGLLLGDVKSLRVVGLNCNAVSDAVAASMCAALKQGSAVEQLSLWKNGAFFLVRALGVHTGDAMHAAAVWPRPTTLTRVPEQTLPTRLAAYS